METPKPPGTLNFLVQAYIQEWEEKVKRNLQACKTMLFMSRNTNERAFLKENIETLTVVLHRLQGKTQEEHPTITKQREEIATLRSCLRANRIQLCQANERQRQYEPHEYTKEMCATKLSMASTLNMDLRCKSNNIRKQLQQQTEEDFQGVCDDMKDLQVEATEQMVTEGPELRMVTEGPERRMVTEGPELRMVTEGPELRMVTEGPELRMVTEAPKLRMVTEGPKLRMVTEGPELRGH